MEVLYPPFKELARWRAANNLSQRAVARLLGVVAQTVSYWETGKSRPKMIDEPQLLARLDALLQTGHDGGDRGGK